MEKENTNMESTREQKEAESENQSKEKTREGYQNLAACARSMGFLWGEVAH